MHPNRSWSTAEMNDLPDSAFLYVEPGGRRDSTGRTVPRTLRHFPYKDSRGRIDLPHLRNALSRIPQSSLPQGVRVRLEKKAQKILGRHGGYQGNPPSPPPRRRHLPAPPRSRLDVHRRPKAPGARPTLSRLSRMLEEREREERPFDPERPPTWRGSASELVVNPTRDWRRHGEIEIRYERQVPIEILVRDYALLTGSKVIDWLRERGMQFQPYSHWTDLKGGGGWVRDVEVFTAPIGWKDYVLGAEEIGVLWENGAPIRVWISDYDMLTSYNVLAKLHELGASYERDSIWSEVDDGWERPLVKWKGDIFRGNHGNVTQVYINPFQDSSKGFYARSTEEYERGLEKLKKIGIEEYEVDFIDGSSAHAELFSALKIGPSDVALWFDTIEHLDDDQMAALFHRAELGVDWREEIDEVESRTLDPWPREGTVREYAKQLVDDIGISGVNNPEFYFDYESFGRDLQISGDLTAGAETDAEREEIEERYEGMSDREIGEEYVESLGSVSDLPKEIQEHYFDYDALARDMELGGDVDEFELGGTTYNIDTR